jgi:hypothetical protein
VDLRYRYEKVDQQGFERDARASTLRLRLGYTTGTYYGFFVGTDLEYITTIGADTYNQFENGLTQYPVIADPEDTELNRAFLGYSGLKNTLFKLGRQRIKLDNLRFFGNVGWRQNEQTFDAFVVSTEIAERATITAGYVDNVNTIWGDSHPTRSDINLSAPIFHAAVKIPKGTMVAYAHFLDNQDSPGASHKNFGIRYSGKHAFNDNWDLLYAGEYADQSDYEEGSSVIDAEYYTAEIGARWKRVTGKLGYEVLGSNDGMYGFATPFATLHKFNGWADQFLATPANGLEDTYVSISADLWWKLKAMVVYHDFSADEGGEDFGTEWDAQVSRAFKKKYSVAVKYANFDTDSSTKSDISKLWGMLGLKF